MDVLLHCGVRQDYLGCTCTFYVIFHRRVHKKGESEVATWVYERLVALWSAPVLNIRWYMRLLRE